ncbi:hypothetical protein TNCT_501921 [Trichonephila clavata]|uniref:Uncharacterized protein n=1 Tax=Trichonephila clavata TaxID=2740835 RepID=A0A8X6FX42_TRICU|nr:hypothetical protein TNCT_501921 [Trichonephila clavata]
MIDLEISFQELDFNKSPGMDGTHGQMLINLSQRGRCFPLDMFNTSLNAGKLEIGKKPSSSPLENVTNRLMTPTVIDKSHLPASRANSWRGLSCLDFLLFLTKAT